MVTGFVMPLIVRFPVHVNATSPSGDLPAGENEVLSNVIVGYCAMSKNDAERRSVSRS
jgi:hypothetical protein